ncbi:MAG: radical SAM protein [Elusimicrobiota bacterium]
MMDALEVYLTSRCNLDCSYCSSRFLRGERKTLSERGVLRGVDLYAAHVGPGNRAAVGFTGGEPLLEYGLLRRVIGRIRSRHPGFEVVVATNGTLLDPGKVEALLGLGARIVVSLDGAKRANDRHRRFKGNGRGSVFDAVSRRIAGLDVVVTLTSETLGSMAESIRCLKRLGARDIWINFDLFEVWTAPKLRRLREVLARVRRLCSGLRGVHFECNDADDRAGQLSRELVLSPDGTFFACNAFGPRVGDLKGGLDPLRLRRVQEDALRRLPEGHGLSLYPFLDRHHYARMAGLDPAAMVAGGCRAGRVLREELGAWMDAERVLDRLRTDRHFGDFEHPPRFRAARELRSIVLTLGSGLEDELARARQAVDYCLYSPGSGKTVVLKGPSDRVECIGLYAALKAEHLGKNVRVLAEDARRLHPSMEGLARLRGGSGPGSSAARPRPRAARSRAGRTGTPVRPR